MSTEFDDAYLKANRERIKKLERNFADACPRCSDLIAAIERDVFEATGVCETCAALTPKDERHER